MKCFYTKFKNLEGRLDSHFYDPSFVNIDKLFSNLNYRRIKEIAIDVKSGSTPPGGIFNEKGIPFLRSQDFNLYDFAINQYITSEFHKKILRSLIKPKDVLIATVGATLGKIGFVPEEISEGNINQNISRIRVKKGEVDSEYLAIFLYSNVGQKQLFRNATITTQQYLNNQQINKIKVPIIPVHVQRQIIETMRNAFSKRKNMKGRAISLINSIDEYLFSKLGLNLQKLRSYKCFKVNSKEIKNNRIDPHYHQPKFKEIEEILYCGKYSIKKLSNFITSINYGISVENTYVNDGIPLLRILNLKANNIDINNIVKITEDNRKKIGKGFVYENDLLISRSGSIGIVSVVPKKANGFAFGSYMIKFKVKNINNYYVSAWLNSSISKQFITRNKIGALQGNITIPSIKNLLIPVPPLKLQKEISKAIEFKIEESINLENEADNIMEESRKDIDEMIIRNY